jgi:ketosteroid isomerase-like protein
MTKTKAAEAASAKRPQTRLKLITQSRLKYLNLLIVVTALNLFASPADAQNDNALIQETNAQFYKALNAVFAGNLEPMKEVWSHSDDVTYMGPDGGFRKGWNQVLADWQRQASLKLGGKVEPSDVVVNSGKDLAICHDREKGHNKDRDGKTVMVSIRATNIFRKEGNKWRVIGHHTDRLPFREK